MALVLFNSIVAGYPIPGLGLLLGFACRQGKGEAAPFAHLAFGLDLAAGQGDQHLADMQPQAAAAGVQAAGAVLLIKALKHKGQGIRRNAVAGVLDGHPHHVVFLLDIKLDDAIRRGHLYADAGAEILFIEALRDREEVERLAREFEGTGTYLFANMIEGGKTPIIPASELKEMGYAGVFWSCASLYLVAKTLKDAFTELARDGTSDAFLSRMIDFSEFNHFIGLDRYRELEKRYAADDKSQP